MNEAAVAGLTPRQRAKRQAILNTVREQLSEGGYEGLTIRSIADGAGVSPSTLYEIFHSKDSLVLAAIRDSLKFFAAMEADCEPGLDHLVMRLDSLATGLEVAGEVASQLLFRSEPDSEVTALLLNGAIAARRDVLIEMKRLKQVNENVDVGLYSRLLAYATWGPILLSVKGVLPKQELRRELIRSSVEPLLAVATEKSKQRMIEILSS